MTISNLPLMSAMQEKLKYHAARQSALAQNVANVDTPGYRAKDITSPDFASYLNKAGNAHMVTTNARHMQPNMPGSKGFTTIDRENTYELNPMGNNVVIEEEMMKVAENQSEYQKILSIYRKSIEMFKIAIGRPTGA